MQTTSTNHNVISSFFELTVDISAHYYAFGVVKVVAKEVSNKLSCSHNPPFTLVAGLRAKMLLARISRQVSKYTTTVNS